MLEVQVELRLVSEVGRRGGICYKFTSGETGVPDRIVVAPGGKVAFVELKKPKGGKLSSMQRFQIERLRQLGVPAMVIKSYDDVDKFIMEVFQDGV